MIALSALTIARAEEPRPPDPTEQNLDVGTPFIHNFTPDEFGGGLQNWAVTQDERGVMYFANQAGLLEFDGVNWKLIEISLRIMCVP